MTAEEFFSYVPDNNQRAELIDGEIIFQAAPSRLHQRVVRKAVVRLSNFIESRHGSCEPFMAPFDVRLDDFTVVQPDVMVTCDPSRVDDKRMNGAPDFIIEVLSGNRSRDLLQKTGLYQRCGVREYWIVDPVHEKTLVYCFEKSDLPNIYTFDTPIPVGIFDGQLTLCIAEMIL